MSRTLRIKKLTNTRLLKEYGSWFYCEGCNESIGYLCYVTYDSFQLDYQCKCGGCGSIYLSFIDEKSTRVNNDELIIVKNRFCCPNDQSPLLTLLMKKLDYYKFEVVCKTCNTKYMEEKTL